MKAAMQQFDFRLPPALKEMAEVLARDGFAHVPASMMRTALEADGLVDLDGFAASWDGLELDRYMGDGGRYRRRRFASFSVSSGQVQRKPHQPHYQSRDYNHLNGGVARWFEPVREDIAAHPATLAMISACDRLFIALTPHAERPEAWHVEMHQFRIEAQPGIAAQPTPEGLHRDGVDWVLALLVRRENVECGETQVADQEGQLIGSFILAEPLDSALVDDTRVYHGVTPIHPLDPTRPAWRDVLVLTFRRE
jgi:hypothetical protein